MKNAIIAISLIKGIGGAFFKKNLHQIKYSIHNPQDLHLIDSRLTVYNIEQNTYIANQIITDCLNNHIEIITIIDEHYPKKLLEINSPPPVLYARGNLLLLESPILSIIGTRKSTLLGNNIANKLGRYFSDKFSICNGLVDGIDRNAITEGFDVFRNVVGVISGGLIIDETLSKTTLELSHKVLKHGGLILSEELPRKREDQYSGSKSSRIQAGISSVMVLVQSKIDGGSKYTLKAFCTLGRSLYVIRLSNSHEFDTSEYFEANRNILQFKTLGIARMCDLRMNVVKVNIKPLSSKDNYIILDHDLTFSNNTTGDIFMDNYYEEK